MDMDEHVEKVGLKHLENVEQDLDEIRKKVDEFGIKPL